MRSAVCGWLANTERFCASCPPFLAIQPFPDAHPGLRVVALRCGVREAERIGFAFVVAGLFVQAGDAAEHGDFAGDRNTDTQRDQAEALRNAVVRFADCQPSSECRAL